MNVLFTFTCIVYLGSGYLLLRFHLNSAPKTGPGRRWFGRVAASVDGCVQLLWRQIGFSLSTEPQPIPTTPHPSKSSLFQEWISLLSLFRPSVFQWIYPYTWVPWKIGFSLSTWPITNTNKTTLFSFSLANWVSEDPITKDGNNRHPWITLNIHPWTTTLYREVKLTIEFHKPLWQNTGFIDTPRPDTHLNNIHPWT